MTAQGHKQKRQTYQNTVRYLRHVARHLNADGMPMLSQSALALAKNIEVLVVAGRLPRPRV